MHEAEQLTAVVQETTFRNEDNGYTVLRVGSGRSQQTVVGVMPELSPGENVTFEGYEGEKLLLSEVGKFVVDGKETPYEDCHPVKPDGSVPSGYSI